MKIFNLKLDVQLCRIVERFTTNKQYKTFVKI